MRVIRALFIGLSISFYLYGCVSNYSPVCLRDGISYGKTCGIFIGKYFDYYERGRSYMEGGCFDYAMADFKSAIDRRSEDTRAARTYRTNFIDYFPHRELGIIEYFLGNDLRAKKELELSLKQTFSDKALFYFKKVINRIQKKEIKQPISPLIQMIKPLNSTMRTNKKNMTICGIIQSDQFLTKIIINDEPYEINSLLTHFKFNKHVQLKNGKNIISIFAKNIHNQQSARYLEIIYDKSPPQIMITSFEKNKKLSGIITDVSGIKTFSVNGKKLETQKKKEFQFIIDFTQNMVELFVEDSLGNSTIDIIHLKDLKKSSRQLLAFNGSTILFDATIDPMETEKSVFIINKWMNNKSVYLDEIVIKGKLIGQKYIQKFSLDIIHDNGKKTKKNMLDFSSSKGCYISFCESVSLSVGKNVLIFECHDTLGHVIQETIEIERLISDIYQLKNRLNMEAFPFITQRIGKRGFFEQFLCIVNPEKCFSGIEGEERFQYGLFQFSFLCQLVSLNRFQLGLDKQLEDAFHSLDFDLDQTTTNIFDSKMDTSLVGDIFESRYGIYIVLKLIDNESSDILTIVDIYNDQKNVKTLTRMANNLAKRLCQQFPFVSGYVENIQSEIISANFLGQSLKSTPYILVYRNKIKYMETSDSQIGEQSDIIGLIKVINNDHGNYIARLLDSKKQIRPGDLLYPK